ncbi:hypothetical protein HN51_003268 [Arachis hypogaea]
MEQLKGGNHEGTTTEIPMDGKIEDSPRDVCFELILQWFRQNKVLKETKLVKFVDVGSTHRRRGEQSSQQRGSTLPTREGRAELATSAVWQFSHNTWWACCFRIQQVL